MAASLVPADEIDAAWEAIAGAMRSRFLVVASDVGPRLMAVKTAAEAQDVIRAEIHAALSELAGITTVEVDEPFRSGERTTALLG